MIRRHIEAAGSEPAWMLIDQVEHARLSGALAEHWGAHNFWPVEPRDTVLAAIYRHDDGWADYDRLPELDPHGGHPLSFTELDVAPAQAIWARSIQKVADLGPLAQYMVAGHFVALRRDGDRADTLEGARFVREFEARCHQWLRQWHEIDPQGNTTSRARRAIGQLQLFDALSLWFCCAQRHTPSSFVTPEGAELELSPRDAHRVEVAPWPFVVDRVDIQANGRQIPARFYADQASLAAAAAVPMELHWTLTPSLDGTKIDARGKS